MKVFKQRDLPWSEIAHELVGAQQGLEVTVLFVDAPPGRGPALHRHPYAELFIVLDGTARFTVNGQQIDVVAGGIIVAEANEPHAFVNTGAGVLRQIDIHLSPSFSTEWLDEHATNRDRRHARERGDDGAQQAADEAAASLLDRPR